MPLSPQTKQTRRDEHAKNENADIIYRIITNKKRSPKPSPSKSPKPSNTSPKPSNTSPKKPSPSKSPSNTSLPPVSLRDLPDDVLRRLTLINYKSLLTTYKLRDWIPPRKIDWSSLSLNPNAIDFLSLAKNKKHIDYSQLCKNTNPRAMKMVADELARSPNNPNIDWYALSGNPYAIDILDANRYNIEWSAMSSNTSPKAIQLINDIQLARANGRLTLYWYVISANTSTEAVNFLNLPENYSYIWWDFLSANTNPKAIEMLIKKESEEFNLNNADFNSLKDNQRISWKNLSGNPKAISLLEKKWEEEKVLMRDNMAKYKILRKKEYILAWDKMSGNPNAIHLLRAKIAEERKMSAKEYKKLEDAEKVNWKNLSANEKAIRLLEENPTKIDWYELCKNPKAIRVIEKELLVRPENINWNRLSQNHAAVRILENNKDKIVWSYFSANPSAGELLQERIEYEKKMPKDKKNPLDWAGISKNPSIFTY
jgi:hypothetical protein